MKNILLCSSNPLLTKSLYSLLRDEGYAVEIVEHPALAVQEIISGTFSMMVLDSEPFGLSSEDAVQIIRTVKPDLPIISLGSGSVTVSTPVVAAPLDLEEFKRMVHSMAA